MLGIRGPRNPAGPRPLASSLPLAASAVSIARLFGTGLPPPPPPPPPGVAWWDIGWVFTMKGAASCASFGAVSRYGHALARRTLRRAKRPGEMTT